MNLQELEELYKRDMGRLRKEIELIYDVDLWTISGDIKNSVGNLAIHLCGNLQHFIGQVLGNTGYKRDRVHEFQARDLEKAFLLSEIDATISMIKNVLPAMAIETMKSEYPIQVFGKPITTSQFMMHLYGHLSYHLGQINYRRRQLL